MVSEGEGNCICAVQPLQSCGHQNPAPTLLASGAEVHFLCSPENSAKLSMTGTCSSVARKESLMQVGTGAVLSFVKYLLGAYCVPGASPGFRHEVRSKRPSLLSWGLQFTGEEGRQMIR